MEQWTNGMMKYWDHWRSITLKNNTVHGINKSGIEKTSTEYLFHLGGANPVPLKPHDLNMLYKFRDTYLMQFTST